MQWEPVIGLEVHVQLSTASKIFSGAATAYGAEPNTQACAIDLALPGVLPVLNKGAVHLAIRLGLSINGSIAPRSIFARKNYFYPDLPKGYQISQHDLPIVNGGYLDIDLEDGTSKRINIIRAHLEEDAGKSIHEGMPGFTGIDLNRAGTPLLEIVSAPEMSSAKEAVAYLKNLHSLVRCLGVSDGNMQEGSFRCDVNVSLRPKGETTLGTRNEIKNINSFRFVERAILSEIERQTELLNQGEKIIQQTRLYDADKDETRPMRSKEEAHDYRYFPDPDLLPLVITDELIADIKQSLPELPWEKRKRFTDQYGLNNYDAQLLTAQGGLADYFEAILTHATDVPPKLAANWIAGDLAAELNKNNLDIADSPVTAKQLAQMLRRISDNTLSSSMAKQVFAAMWQGEGDADSIIEKKGLKQISDSGELEKIIDDLIANNPTQTAEYRAGKDKLITFFVGQAMKATKGKANPQQLTDLLKKKLSPL